MNVCEQLGYLIPQLSGACKSYPLALILEMRLLGIHYECCLLESSSGPELKIFSLHI